MSFIRKSVPFLAAALLVGCQSTSRPIDNYVYVPYKLSSDVVFELKGESFNFKNLDIHVRFVEEESYLEIKHIAEPNFVYRYGIVSSMSYEELCMNDGDFSQFLREYGVGVKYIFKDGRSEIELGPWNVDACHEEHIPKTVIKEHQSA